MYRSGSGAGETSCVHSCWRPAVNKKTQFIVMSIKSTWSPVRESRRGGSLSEMQNTISPRTWGLSAGGGDVIRITQLWQRKWSEHTSIPAKNWCCWFERMLPDGKTDRVCSECIQSRQCLCHKSQVSSWSWNRVGINFQDKDKLCKHNQTSDLQIDFSFAFPMNPSFISLQYK